MSWNAIADSKMMTEVKKFSSKVIMFIVDMNDAV